MRTYLTAAISLALLAGCSSDQGAPAGKSAAAASAEAADAQLPSLAQRAGTTSFASMPDRGELLAYEQVRKPKRSGAYTAYPVAISESHALNAMRTGEMVVKAPDGELIRLRYDRHIEHDDGNWSWIGHNSGGGQAILTFGEKAVFGVVPQGATETLRLTMGGGQSWLVQTDRSKLAGADGAKRRESGDQLVPPKLAAAAAAAERAATMQAAPATAGATASTAVVDVLLGYTKGYASQLGGQSAALTRLNNMVVISNEAYQNSGVNMRIRAVKAVQVDYPDNTDNGDTLEKLTGYTAGDDGGPTTPDPAFNELRAARDTSGADLVSLVRAFRTPENNGCGIAWLIGSEQSGISTADAPFGYSVVSDGNDVDEDDGFTYGCRDETLAHELGHNMGQAHNAEDSETSGVHAYSYGYREAASDGFYTVMAYPQEDGEQFSIRYFANPNVRYSGRPTGVANQADNVRSMNVTMPIVATFRNTVVPSDTYVRNDVNGDGLSDLIWENPGGRQFGYWRMSGEDVVDTRSFSNITAGYSVAATGDFNGDGRGDVLWINTAQRVLYVWFAQANGAFSSSLVGSYPAGWTVAGAGDVNADGKWDIYWENVADRQFGYWRMDGKNISQAKTFKNITAGYRVFANGDFNRDGRDDVLWGSASERKLYLWTGTSSGAYSSKLVSTYPAGWNVVAASDVTGDGRADILWHNASARQFAYWPMNGATRNGSQTFSNLTSGYAVAATGDFDGDGRGDVLWRNSSQRTLYVWLATASGRYASKYVGTYPAGWQLFR